MRLFGAGRREEPERTARRAAFEGLAKEQQAGLLRAARRLCVGDEDGAQDLVQDTLVAAYAAHLEGRFREGSNARAWMLTSWPRGRCHRRTSRCSGWSGT